MIHFKLKLGVLGGLLALASSAYAANPYLPGLTNLDFSQYTGVAPKASFTAVNPVGWTGGSGLIFIDSGYLPNASAAGPVYLTTYGNPGTGHYNYVEADGNPSFESGFNFQLTGLTVGQTYTITFFQGASQQVGFANGLNTTEQWIVSLGTSGLQFCNGCGPADPYYGGNDSTYYNPDATASVVASPLMVTPSAGTTPWQMVSLDLTADSTTDILSFLAWGDNGNTVNLPPIVFLTGVDSPTLPTPEPAALTLVGVALVGLGGVRYRQRNKSHTVA